MTLPLTVAEIFAFAGFDVTVLNTDQTSSVLVVVLVWDFAFFGEEVFAGAFFAGAFLAGAFFAGCFFAGAFFVAGLDAAFLAGAFLLGLDCGFLLAVMTKTLVAPGLPVAELWLEC